MHFTRTNVDNFYFAFLATRKKKIFSECVGLVKDYCGATLAVVRSVKRRAAALIKDFHFGARTRPPHCALRVSNEKDCVVKFLVQKFENEKSDASVGLRPLRASSYPHSCSRKTYFVRMSAIMK